MLKYVAKLSGISEGHLECDKDGVHDIRAGESYRIGFEELAKIVYERGNDIYEKYYYIAPQTSPMQECSDNPSYAVEKYRLHFSYSFGVQAVIVEVDEDTGEVKVLRVYAANDAGRAINPALVEGQIEGGIAMGIGYALSEKFLMKDGYVLTKQLKDMGIPRATDISADIKTFIVEEHHPYGPFGAKGMGELPLNATAPAILNAIYDAVGVRAKSLPVTPDKLLKLMQEKR